MSPRCARFFLTQIQPAWQNSSNCELSATQLLTPTIQLIRRQFHRHLRANPGAVIECCVEDLFHERARQRQAQAQADLGPTAAAINTIARPDGQVRRHDPRHFGPGHVQEVNQRVFEAPARPNLAERDRPLAGVRSQPNAVEKKDWASHDRADEINDRNYFDMALVSAGLLRFFVTLTPLLAPTHPRLSSRGDQIVSRHVHVIQTLLT